MEKEQELGRGRIEPVVGQADEAAVGEKLFHQHVAGCHGANEKGHGKKPSLRSQRINNATDGELFWLLTNGNISKGMPSWSRLPEGQRWDVVSYLNRLESASTAAR